MFLKPENVGQKQKSKTWLTDVPEGVEGRPEPEDLRFLWSTQNEWKRLM